MYSLLIWMLLGCSLANFANANVLWMSENTYGRSAPVCVDIPRNFTLCNDLEYRVMRLPNLFGHETLDEIFQQATGWIPLFQLGCHPKTKLFLCSLFTPVCLEQTIPPCRSLCESVKSSCEHHMLKHGYPWPRIVDCAQYPVDNDMCIKAHHHQPPPPSPPKSDFQDSEEEAEHQVSRSRSRPTLSGPQGSGHKTDTTGHQSSSYGIILNRYCMANWTMRAKGNLYWNSSDAYLQITNFRMLYGELPHKAISGTNSSNGELFGRFLPLRVPHSLVDSASSKKGSMTGRKYLIIGQTLSDQRLKVVLVTSFNTKSKSFRKAIKEIKEDDVDCEADEVLDVVASFYSEPLKLRKTRKLNQISSQSPADNPTTANYHINNLANENA